jgi:2'-5' RNA ligase
MHKQNHGCVHSLVVNAAAVAKSIIYLHSAGIAIAWWLVPNVSCATTLHSTTAARHDSPMFHPHVTLFLLNDTDKTTKELANIAQTVIARVEAPISLEEAGVQAGETFDQSVYLALKPTSELMTLRANLLKAAGAPASTKSPAFPHASLYYGEGQSATTSMLSEKCWKPA